jgi:hypothetical protein
LRNNPRLLIGTTQRQRTRQVFKDNIAGADFLRVVGRCFGIRIDVFQVALNAGNDRRLTAKLVWIPSPDPGELMPGQRCRRGFKFPLCLVSLLPGLSIPSGIRSSFSSSQPTPFINCCSGHSRKLSAELITRPKVSPASAFIQRIFAGLHRRQQVFEPSPHCFNGITQEENTGAIAENAFLSGVNPCQIPRRNHQRMP